MNLSKYRNRLPDALDVAVFLGAGLVVYGTRLIYPPLAFIVAGTFLLIIGGLGIVAAKRKATKP
jgi:hypothetical protein